jgi:hypothetical protein
MAAFAVLAKRKLSISQPYLQMLLQITSLLKIHKTLAVSLRQISEIHIKQFRNRKKDLVSLVALVWLA